MPRQVRPTSPKPSDNSLSSASKLHDPVNHPSHYTSHPSGVECITITEWMTFNLGNAVKYIWRAGQDTDRIEDLEKARWYISREIKRLGGPEEDRD